MISPQLYAWSLLDIRQLARATEIGSVMSKDLGLSQSVHSIALASVIGPVRMKDKSFIQETYGPLL